MGVYSLPDELRPSQPSPSPSPLALQAGPGGILGCPCVANKLEEIGCLVGGGTHTALAVRKQASGLHVCVLCKHTYAQPHAHPRTGTHTPTASRPLTLLALISLCFPEAAPTSGTAEPRTAPPPRLQRGAGKSPIQTCASSAPHF